MAMSKKRQEIWNKSNGHCWYCGCELGEKGWHADHFEPIHRHWWDGSKTCDKPELDTIENLVPSCASCNINKHSMPLESWRQVIYGYVVSLNRDSTQYKLAKRFGLVEETKVEVKFWYEKNGLG